MSKLKAVTDHYTHGDLLKSIQDSITRLGKTTDTLQVDDLAPVDEFHIGGRQATKHFFNQLNLAEQEHILDIGCGLGGASRFAASQYNSRVTGIDLTPEYIATGNTLCEWVGLAQKVTLHQASALCMPFQDQIFDGGFMMHVGMNIEDKAQLFAEVYRVLRPGSTFGVYDVMQLGNGELTYPVPWAGGSHTSSLANPEQYKQAMLDAGFTVAAENDRRDFALDFLKTLREKTEANGGPPALGLHTLVREDMALKFQNLTQSIETGHIAPVEIIVQKN